MNRLRRHRFDVPILPLADWRMARVRLMRMNGHSRRDSNFLVHERARLDARLAALIWPAPLVFPSMLITIDAEVGPVADPKVYLPPLSRRQRLQRIVCR